MTENEIFSNYAHGDSYTAMIEDVSVEGKISLNNGAVFFCHNADRKHGSDAPDKLGYQWSWRYDGQISNLVITKTKFPEEIINNYEIF